MATDDDHAASSPGARTRGFTWIAAMSVVVAAVVAASVIATRARISGNESARVARALEGLLPAGSFDNSPGADRVMVTDPGLLGSDEPVPVYRARLGGRPVAAIVTVVARQGYVGPIRLLVSIGVDGRVIAVRAVEQHETPGLGDQIDAAKSGWLRRFTGHALGDPPADDWGVARDGGAFDQITGATVTSRAVVRAVRDAASYFAAHRDDIFSPSGS